ncbi:aminoacyl-tRNA hydrolase [Candidatus Shapirobacteria bacterium]|nr:aminoacyl-tRNA hydrolase [Candidatus Shapirobacteria bacterium]
MKLYIGLGNPGKKYESTRHNLGHVVISKLAGTLTNSPKLSAQILKDKNTIFAITNEYMNNSGIAVAKIANYYKIVPENIFVIHDDLDLPAGEWKIQFDRGPAGHNGVISTVQHLGTQAINRIRIGIGHPQNNLPVEDYVLLPFTSKEKVLIEETIDKIVEDIRASI